MAKTKERTTGPYLVAQSVAVGFLANKYAGVEITTGREPNTKNNHLHEIKKIYFFKVTLMYSKKRYAYGIETFAYE